MSAATLKPHTLEAFNTSKESENKIHDDAVARRFGFAGGLVPGVDVYGYMTHMPVARWGRAWLERGVATCRLLKPVYDGEMTTVTAEERGGELQIEVHSRDTLCATGTAALPAAAIAPPSLDAYPEPPSLPADRPPADEGSLAVGTRVGMEPLPITPAFVATYVRDVRETEPVYTDEGLVHPGTVLRAGNWVLRHNVVLGPWIHVGSAVRHFAAARIGQTLTARGHVTANYDHKGHQFVELDILVLADNEIAVAQIAHTAIYRPRQVVAA